MIGAAAFQGEILEERIDQIEGVFTILRIVLQVSHVPHPKTEESVHLRNSLLHPAQKVR